MEKPFKDSFSSRILYSSLSHRFTKSSFFSSKTLYTSLSQRLAKPGTNGSSGRVVKTLFCVVTALLTLSVFIAIAILTASKTSIIADCGDSAAEARARHCKFDQLLYAWVPEACFAQALHEQYTSDGQSTAWFLYTNTSRVTDIATIEEGQVQIIYTNDEWQSQQCTYLWESLGRGVYEGKQVVEWAANLTRSTDCTKLFLDVFDLGLEWDRRKWLKQEVNFLRCEDLTARDL